MQQRKLVDKTKRELLALYVAVAIMYLIPAIVSEPFRGAQNMTNILNQMAPVGFVALGQTFPILTTGIDLSVGPVVSMTTALAATYMGFSLSMTLKGLILCLLAGLAVGIVNGLVITRLTMPTARATDRNPRCFRGHKWHHPGHHALPRRLCLTNFHQVVVLPSWQHNSPCLRPFSGGTFPLPFCSELHPFRAPRIRAWWG